MRGKRHRLSRDEELTPKSERFTTIALSRDTRRLVRQLQNEMFHDHYDFHSADDAIRAAVESYRKQRSLKAIESSTSESETSKAIDIDSDASLERVSE